MGPLSAGLSHGTAPGGGIPNRGQMIGHPSQMTLPGHMISDGLAFFTIYL